METEDDYSQYIDIEAFKAKCESYTKALSNVYSELFIDI